jgi:hypothetical protein
MKLAFSQQFVLEIAADWDDPEEICKRHGVSSAAYKKLQNYKPFIEAVAETKVALTGSGKTASFKARALVEDLIPTIYKIAKLSEDEKIQLEAFAQLSKLGGLDTKSNTLGTGATGYSLNISFNGQPADISAAPVPVLDAEIMSD